MDYRDIVHFANKAALDTYIDAHSGPGYNIPNVSYAKPGQPIRINMPFNRVYKWNYVRATNPAQPLGAGVDAEASFYYFITDIKYINPSVTEIQVQLDVWQTFSRDVSFGQCFIERGHIGIANSQNFDDYGRTWLTVPEGLDIGNEYIISDVYEHELVNINDEVLDLEDLYGIVVCSTTSLNGDFGTIDNPKLKTGSGSLFERLPNGCEIYYFDEPASYLLWMGYMKDFPWVTQGILSITVVPRITGGVLPGSFSPKNFGKLVGDPTWDESIKMYTLTNVYTLPTQSIIMSENFRADFAVNSRYSHLKKFLTYPYSLIELTTFSGNPLILKPECINTFGLVIERMTHLAPPNPRIIFYPKGYNAPAGNTDIHGGEFLNMMTGIFDLPMFAINNNSYLGYMASNRNAIAYQHSSADWSQQRAMRGADTAYRQADKSMDAMNSSTYARNNAAGRAMALQNQVLGQRSVQSGANSVIDGLQQAATRDVLGGVTNALQGAGNAMADYAIGSNQNFQQNAITTGLTSQQNDIAQGLAAFNRDTNVGYAEFAAKGDYANNIAAINAKVQDARLLQPTTSGQIGGDAFMLAAYKWGVWARLKTIQPAAQRVIGEYWLRYGYAVNTFGQMPSDYQCMENFTYWKLHETYLTSGTCPETFKQTIRGIFEKGVTVWNNPAKIGQTDMADNTPRSGVTL